MKPLQEQDMVKSLDKFENGCTAARMAT